MRALAIPRTGIAVVAAWAAGAVLAQGSGAPSAAIVGGATAATATTAGSAASATAAPYGSLLPTQNLELTVSPALELDSRRKSQLDALAEVDRLYTEGRHEAAGTLGANLIAEGAKVPDALRLKIANGLAWSGRSAAASEQYRLLLNGPYDSQARFALASALRWQDRSDLAQNMYRQVLAQEPGNAGARDGLIYADRGLRPSTTFGLTHNRDNGGLRRNAGMVTHRWRNAAGNEIYEVEGRVLDDHLDPPGLHVRGRNGAIRYQDLDAPLAPRWSLDFNSGAANGLFGGVRLRLEDGPTYLYLERLAWGVVALSPRALELGQTALHVGLETQQGFTYGSLYARASLYNVSDSNRVLSTSARFTPWWRPLGVNFKPYVALDTRDVRFNTVNYWSPAAGSGVASLGLQGDWSDTDWYLTAAGQFGRPLYGEAGNVWSGSAAGKRWISRDYALGFNLWGMSSWRDGLNYRARSLNLTLEKLW